MNVTQQGVLTLLKSAITGRKLPLPEGFDLETAYSQFKRHHMSTLIYDGALFCGISRQNPMMQKLFQNYCKALLVSEGQMRELARVFAAFDGAGIDYMSLKGSNMKALYPKPELRMMGDADVLIRVEQYERIVPVMEKLGFTAVLESDHELIWQSPSLYLELHKFVIPTYNDDFYAYFGDGWRLAKKKTGCRHFMTAEDELIYNFTHFAKHFRDGGIGCRHVLDLWVYCRSKPELDYGYIRAELKKLQLLDFFDNIRRLVAAWFEDGEMDETLELISTFIFSSGSWGAVESKLLSGSLKGKKDAPAGLSGRMRYLWSNLFPGVDRLRQSYPVLNKAPWLLGAVWVIRGVRMLLFRRENLKIHERNLRLLDREKLDARQQLLDAAGLDFHF